MHFMDAKLIEVFLGKQSVPFPENRIYGLRERNNRGNRKYPSPNFPLNLGIYPFLP